MQRVQKVRAGYEKTGPRTTSPVSLISTELATWSTSLKQSSKRSFKGCVPRRASGELASQQKARRNRTISVGLQHWALPISTETPRSTLSFLGKLNR